MFFFIFKQKTAYEISACLVGSEMCIRDRENAWRAKVPVIFMAFDLMCEHGALTLDLPLRERRNRLEAIVEKISAHTVSPLEIDPHANDAQTSLFSAQDLSAQAQ